MGRALSTYATDPSDYEPDGLKKHVKPDTARQLERLAGRFAEIADWTAASTEAALRETAEAENVAAGKLIHPLRLALTGLTVGAPLFDVVELLGKETVSRRIWKFVDRIKTQGPVAATLPSADSDYGRTR
jgi:glutamyl-tRNA synthetase